jgi:hypothetical protein
MNKLINGKFVELTSDEEAAIAAEETKVKAEIAANGYKRARARTYPEIGEQLDTLFHAIEADSDLKTKFAGFYNVIKAVKDANPKPS